MSDKSPPNRTMPNQMNARAEAEIREWWIDDDDRKSAARAANSNIISIHRSLERERDRTRR